MTQIHTREIASDVIDICLGMVNGQGNMEYTGDKTYGELLESIEEYLTIYLEEAGLRNRLVVGKFKDEGEQQYDNI